MTTTEDPTDRLVVQDGRDTQRRADDEAPIVPAVQTSHDPHAGVDGGDSQDIRGGQTRADIHRAHATADPAPRPANQGASARDESPGGAPVSGNHSGTDAHRPAVAAPFPSGPAIGGSESRQQAPVLADPLLAIVADILDDLERVRIANENRYRQLTRTELDSDDEVRGFGLSPDDPAVQSVAKLVTATKALELEAENNLKRMMRRHALGPWVKRLTGVGEKQAARLLAVIGDPTCYEVQDDEGVRIVSRSVSQLRSYCGWGDARKQVRQRGVKATWSDTAKKRTWVIAESCMKQLRSPCKDTRPEGRVWAEHGEDCPCSPFRVIYDKARQRYEGTVHDIECRRCGPKGKPAEVGSPRSDGHVNAMALRVVSKAILKEMWREGRRLHGQADE